MALIKLKRGTTAGYIPSGLTWGEPAVNTTDGILFCGNTYGNTVNLSGVLSFNGLTGHITHDEIDDALTLNVVGLSASSGITGNSTLYVGSTATFGGAVTGSTATFGGTVTATSFAGALTGNVTGNVSGSAATATTADVATTVTITDNENENESNAIIFAAGGDVDGGNLGLESDGTLTYNPSTGKVTATGFVGTLTGNVTGNASGSAATVTTAAQPNITSVGILTGLTVAGGLSASGTSSFNGPVVMGITGTSYLQFPNGTTQGFAGIEYWSVQGDGSPRYLGVGNMHTKGFDLSSTDASEIGIAQQDYTAPGTPSGSNTIRYILSLGSNVPREDASNTFTNSSGNIFTTPIGSNRYAPHTALDVLLASLDHATATYMGVTAGNINFKVSGTEYLTMDSSGISASGATFGDVVIAPTFQGALTGNVTGNVSGSAATATTADVATTVTITDNENENESNAIIFAAGGDVDGGNLGLESDGTLTYNPSTGKVTATGFVGTLTGDVTGNASGSAATVTTAAQGAITSVGILTGLSVAGGLSASGTSHLHGGATFGGDIYMDGNYHFRNEEGESLIDFTQARNLYLGDSEDAGNSTQIFIKDSHSVIMMEAANEIHLDSPIVYIPDSLVHLSDSDTKLRFETDTISLLAGGVTGTSITPTNINAAVGITAAAGIDVTGAVTATTFVGALTGNVTGNASGSAATVTTAAQGNITSLGTLTALTMGGELSCVDNLVTRPVLKDIAETVNAIGTITGNTAVDFTAGNVQTVTGNGDCEFTFTNPPASGKSGTVTLIITNGGANTTTWHSSVKWPGDNAPALTSSGVDVVSFMTIDAGTTIYGFVGGINFS